jgi:alpha-L-rhamnosidase
MRTITLYLFLLIGINSFAIENLSKSKINPDLMTKYWSAEWVACPDDSGLDYGVYHFRKNFSLNEVPKEFIIHVSADNRYRLFVNGEPVCFGPARGDLMHWHFESIDISPYLKQGENVVASVVWNFADLKPWAQHSLRTAFLVQGNSEKEEIINTNSTWKVTKNNAYKPADASSEKTGGQFIVVGPCDEVDAAKYPWNWEKLDFDDSTWLNAKMLDQARPKIAGSGIAWGLEPREIPLMEAKKQRFSSVRRTENIKVDEAFIAGKKPLIIPPNKTVVILFDQGQLTTAYPELTVSGGAASKIELQYAEALFDTQNNKGNRNEIEGKKMRGYIDFFLPDGGQTRLFRPLWLRTWRYLEMTITTKDSPVRIDNFDSEYTGYPFQENAVFKSNDSQLAEIWNVGWHTARLCAGETYYDCPYYEQMQYVGDTRIQALVSLYVSGDDRLMRNAIQMFDDSRFSEGLTMSRYPSSMPQVIPPYSLFWIDMVHDYWMHRDDEAFVKSFLNGIDNVLYFFISKLDKETGLLGKTGYWNFVDWANEWPWNSEIQFGGVPQGGNTGQSSVLSLHLAYSARHAADLYRWAGDEIKATYYEKVAGNIIKSVKENCWNETKKYFADSPKKTEYSMHSQIFAVLTGAVPENEIRDFVSRFKSDKSLIQPTMYFRFYLTQALKKAGLSDQYLETLDLWRDMLGLGLTTFAEKPDPTRSDCHAWSASPNYDFLATVAGIEPVSPGFKTVKIEPHLGALTQIEGKMPHPAGTILFQLKRNGENGIEGEITLPGNLKGTFIWNDKKIELSGRTEIMF